MGNRFVAGALAAAVVAAGLAMSAPSGAAHHLWQIKQIFSNASGSVQFLSLFTSDPSETNVGGFTVTSGGHVFTFGSSLSGSTANKWILLATSNFAGEPGAVVPDYIIPAGFFATGGGSLNYAGVDTWNYGTVPTDGVHSLMRDGTTAVNSPTNFSGQSGSVNLASAVPAVPRWGLVLLVGGVLLLGSGLVRYRKRLLPAVSP
jgi:hypothetical protein